MDASREASAEAELKVEKFAAMSPAELRAHEREAIRGVLDLELIPPVVETAPDQSVYGFAKLDFAMNGGMAQTPGGRLYAVWFAGADGPGAFLVGTWSDDGGKSWVGTRFVVGQKEPLANIGFARIYRSVLIGNVWCSPDGALRLYVYQAMNAFDGRGAIFEFVCRNPDAPRPTWGAARYLGHGGLHNKPIVLRDGTWLLPTDFEPNRREAFPELDPLRGCGLTASTDGGRTWRLRGRAVPNGTNHYAEHMVVERRDGSLWMLMRTGLGLMESESRDGAWTWTNPSPPAELKQVIARFALLRLSSGALLFVKNGSAPGVVKGNRRERLTAFVSDDDGRTWTGGLALDERGGVSYPDVFQAADGMVYVSYDHNRNTKEDEILFARFSEASVRAGRLVGPGESLKNVVFREQRETTVEVDAMKPFPVLRPVPERLADARRGFQSAPSITASPKGRLWVAWHTGDTTEGDENGMVVVSSGDGGETWTPPLFAIDPPGPLRILDPGLWTDPDGKVWLFYAQLYGMWDGRAGVWAMHPLDPEDANTGWTPARRLCHGYMKNKPIVTRDGTWLLPSEFMNGKPWGGRLGAAKSIPKEFAFEMPEYRAANVFASRDKGQTVSFWGRAQIPPKDRDCTENMVVERRDGTLWMLVRVKYGIAETVSSDGGKAWSELRPSSILNPNSRFFIGRLKSGAMLLVKNGPVGTKTGRSHITAFVSDDDGATWLGGLVLDERKNVSYPDAVESADGFIHVVHDRERTKAREILHHRFTEADVRAGRLVTPGSRLKGIVNKAGPK